MFAEKYDLEEREDTSGIGDKWVSNESGYRKTL